MADLPTRLPLPLTVRTGQVTLTLDVALSDMVIPPVDDYTDDHPNGLRLGDLVAASIAAQVTPDLSELAARAEVILRDTIMAEVSAVVSKALNRQAGTWPEAKREELTLAQLIEAEVWRQVQQPDRNAMARGRTGIPVIDAVIAVAVTEAFRDLTADVVQQVKAKVLADIATMPSQR